MEINNFYQLENLLEFKEGSYYKFIALIRAKDNSGEECFYKHIMPKRSYIRLE